MSLIEGAVAVTATRDQGNLQVMATKLIVIVAASVAVVVLMFVLGKLADGKDTEAPKK